MKVIFSNTICLYFDSNFSRKEKILHNIFTEKYLYFVVFLTISILVKFDFEKYF